MLIISSFLPMFQTNSGGLDLLTVLAFLVILIIVFGIGGYGGYMYARWENSKRRDNNTIKKAVAEARAVERERVRRVYNLLSRLTETLNYDLILDNVMDVSVGAFIEPGSPKNPLVCAALLFSNETLIVHTSRQFTPPDTSRKFAGQQGVLAKVINNGIETVIDKPGEDPELSRIIAMRACTTAYCIPLRSGMDVYGVLLYGHTEPNFFSQENRDVIDVIAAQAMTALQNARLYQDLEDEKRRLIDSQEEARKKLARDLHDGPTQGVAAIAMRVNFTRRLLERNPSEVPNELFKIEDMARRTTKEIRTMLFTLRPLILESQGLRAALDQMAEKINETYNQNVTIEMDELVVEELDISKQGIVFQIAEEAVNNARKHAKAAHTWVRITRVSEDLALLEVQDDGIGFDVEATRASYESRGSMGMVNLRERAEMIRGVLQMESKPGQGTTVQVWVPLSEEAAEKLRHGK